MKFLIIGPGAMGCLFSARLKIAGYHVTLLDYNAERAAQITEHGIRVEGISGELKAEVPVITKKTSEIPDVVLLCVKANQTRMAAEGIKSWIGPKSQILTLQNGIGNIEILEEIFGRESVLGGITAEGATLLGPGHVRHAGKGDTVIGPEDSPAGSVSDIVSIFNKAGFKTRSAKNVNDLIWGKLIINVGINALTAITRLKNGFLPKLKPAGMIMEGAVQEAVSVADAKGITLPYSDPLERVLEVCRATAENIASMLQDVLNQKPTEIAFINGAIVKEGNALGIPTPVNHTLTCLTQTIQETYLVSERKL